MWTLGVQEGEVSFGLGVLLGNGSFGIVRSGSDVIVLVCVSVCVSGGRV